METLHIKRVEELNALAVTVLSKLTEARVEGLATVLAISGDLGAGKTTFMQAFAKQLHIEETVISPTYVIMKKYDIDETDVEVFESLIHIDAYRIEHIDEMRVLRFEEILAEKDTIICIEWAEKLQELLPKHTVFMNIEIQGETKRTFTIN